MSSRFFKMAVLLGLLSAIGPFAIDMYLPALPAIGQNLGAGIGGEHLNHQEVLDAGRDAGPRISRLLADVVGKM